MSTKPPKKFIKEKGILKKNPAYTKWAESQSGISAPPPSKPLWNVNPSVYESEPLAVISSITEFDSVKRETDNKMMMAESTIATLDIMKDADFLAEFQSPQEENMDGEKLLEGLSNYFIKFEVPVGLINKLFDLQDYHLRFIVDDSGSMNANTDSMLSDASLYVLRGVAGNPTMPMTRWQEAETRLHDMMDILAYIPTKSIQIRFLNSDEVLHLQRIGKSVERFTSEAHTIISNSFKNIEVKYKTPTLRVMAESFQAASQYEEDEKCMHYLFTDGVPSDCIVDQVANLIKYRNKPENNPVTLISCTGEDSEVEWMKRVEEVAPYCAEIDDFVDERNEVLKDQGTALPYTRGYWLICQLVAAINPDDLDALDESVPLTKNTLDNVLGRVHTPQEYQYYFERNPHATIYLDLYERFLTEDGFASGIVSKEDKESREIANGYNEGLPTKPPPSPSELAKVLDSITAKASKVTVISSSSSYPKKTVTVVAVPVSPIPK